ncbi:unnamed protein product [Dibothriocephalus latus]|uniref:Uncharacterized protein n=1 Tax=Dibothriocephalus latus TaxID=60516 RepID=A0A3P7R3J5_DIBLA|nr:unnamed protein product [Dibothriocephalus latus]
MKGLSAKLQAAEPSKSATATLPPRLTLAHDPNVLGSKYHTETGLTDITPPQYPPAVLLSPEIVKGQSNFTDGCFVGEMQAGNDGTLIDAATAFADSGRESQEKSSSSANSADAVQDLPAPVDGDSSSSEMDFQVAQVDV